MNVRKISIIFLIAATLMACGPALSDPTRTIPSRQPTAQNLCSSPLRVVATSEVKVLEDAQVFSDFSKETCIPITLAYKGSVDIKNMVAAGQKDAADVWIAASNVWFPGSFIQNKTFFMRSFNVLAVDDTTARQLGWTQKGVSTKDLVDAVKTGKVKLVAPSATQDDSGANAFLAIISSLKGGDLLRVEDIRTNQGLIDSAKAFFGALSRTAAKASDVATIYLDDRVSGKPQFSAVLLPESLAIVLNQSLTKKNAAPVRVFYVRDATSLQTYPMGYTTGINSEKIAQFNKLAEYLKSPKIQERLAMLGFRTNPIGTKVEKPDPTVWNPAWGIDPTGEFPTVDLPKEEVIYAALNAYQLAFRKPSVTYYCLDYSGSMSGDGEKQMKDAMDRLLDQGRASEVLLQATSLDKTTVLAFSDSVAELGTVIGNDANALKGLSTKVQRRSPGGNTALFSCLQNALDDIGKNYNPSQYTYAVIALTDGQSNTGVSKDGFVRYYQGKRLSDNKELPVPVFGIAFGSADFSQLNALKNLKAGDTSVTGSVCDGRRGGDELVRCFREAKGSN